MAEQGETQMTVIWKTDWREGNVEQEIAVRSTATASQEVMEAWTTLVGVETKRNGQSIFLSFGSEIKRPLNKIIKMFFHLPSLLWHKELPKWSPKDAH